MDSETERRVTAVEIKLSYMEDFVSQLQQVLVEQGDLLRRLQEENRLMGAKLRDMAEQLEGDVPNRRPPHY